MLLSGPIGMSNSSAQFWFMYPNTIVVEPSSSVRQPS